MADRREVVRLAVLGAATSVGPLSTDMYLSGLPDLTHDLATTAAGGQLTISACVIGLAVGQLVVGPLSDRIGRRRPLLIGLSLFAVLSLACAVAPSIEILIVLRLLQGVTAATGLALTRAIVRDLYGEGEAVRVFSRLMAIAAVVPVFAPILGGAVLLFADWRGIFVTIAIATVVILAAVWLAIPESLPVERRHSGAASSQLRSIRRLATDGQFLSYVGVCGCGSVILFSFISMSSLAYQEEFGVGVQLFSLIFGANTLAIVLASQANVWLTARMPARTVLLLGVAVAAAAGGLGSAGALAGLGFWWVFAFCLVSVSSLGIISPNTAALAIGPHADNAGTASAFLGTAQFLFGATIPPAITALVGAGSASMTASMGIAGALAVVILVAGRIRRTVESAELEGA